MCSGPAQEAERDGGKTNRMSSDTQREVHGEPSKRTQASLITRNRVSQKNSPAEKLPSRPKRTNLFTGLGRVGSSLLKLSPTYQFFKGLSQTYKGN
jgi:hypothetical protein|tara:strand:+ start:222 stop:509 length:288 start_codon:yes stop_codon:yes gene_type:complete